MAKLKIVTNTKGSPHQITQGTKDFPIHLIVARLQAASIPRTRFQGLFGERIDDVVVTYKASSAHPSHYRKSHKLRVNLESHAKIVDKQI